MSLRIASLSIHRHGNLLQVEHPAYELAWDLARGGVLVFLRDRRSQVTLIDARQGGPGPDVVVAVSATLAEHEHDIRLSSLGQAEVRIYEAMAEQTTRIEMAAQDGEIRIERTIILRADSPWIEERVALQNVSDHDLLIDRYPDWAAAGKTAVAGDLFHWNVNPGGVDYILAGLRIGGDYANTNYVTPVCGYPFFHNRGSFAEMGDTAISLVAGHHGAVLPCIMAYNEPAQTGVLLSCLHERSLRYVRMMADQATQTGTITAQVWWARWLAPRERQEVATWHLVPFIGDYGAMLEKYGQWLASEHNVVPPQDQATHLDELFIACTHNVIVHGLGHVDKMRPYIDAVREVGCTAIFWNRPWLDASDVDKRAWMSRCMPQTRDYRYTLSDAYGGPEAMLGVTDYIHQQGLKEIVWVTGYGLTVFDPLYQQHPEAFVRLRRPVIRQANSEVEGRELIPDYDVSAGIVDPYVYPPFGHATIGGDPTNPHWRKFWLHNQAYWAANGVDGIFFDSFNPMPPNYDLRPWPGQISLEIINLQREARRLARAANPDFFSYTEGGGYMMATVNDFTHTWHGSTPPPLPPYRTRPLSPEEEARFLRDEHISMIPGARAWASLAGADADPTAPGSSRPRGFFTMFGGKLPMLDMFNTSASSEPIRNEPEFWTYFKPHPADRPAPREQALWATVKCAWQIRQANPELKSGRVIFSGVSTDDAAVSAFLRVKDAHVSVVLINFRSTPVSCQVRIDWAAAGVAPPAGSLTPSEVLSGSTLPVTTADQLVSGYPVTIAARDGVILKLA